jgi:hypothetical protein
MKSLFPSPKAQSNDPRSKNAPDLYVTEATCCQDPGGQDLAMAGEGGEGGAPAAQIYQLSKVSAKHEDNFRVFISVPPILPLLLFYNRRVGPRWLQIQRLLHVKHA